MFTDFKAYKSVKPLIEYLPTKVNVLVKNIVENEEKCHSRL